MSSFFVVPTSVFERLALLLPSSGISLDMTITDEYNVEFRDVFYVLSDEEYIYQYMYWSRLR